MLRGEKHYTDRLEIRIKSVFSPAGGSSPCYEIAEVHQVTGASYHQTSVSTLVPDFTMLSRSRRKKTVGASSWSSIVTEHTMTGFGQVLSYSDSTFRTTVESIIVLFGYSVMQDGDATWDIRWTGGEWYCDGTLRGSWAAGQALSVMTPTPFAQPYNMLCEFSAECGATIGNATFFTLPSVSENGGTATATVGYRWKNAAGNWVSIPVDTSLPVSLDDNESSWLADDILSGSNLWEITIASASTNKVEFKAVGYTGEEEVTTGGDIPDDGGPPTPTVTTWVPWEGYRQIQDEKSKKGVVWPIADLDQAVVRLCPDYRALIFRWGLPQAKGKGASYAYKGPLGSPWQNIPVGNSGSAYDYEGRKQEVYPAHTQFLDEVTNSTATIEEPLAEGNYCMMKLTAYKFHWAGGTYYAPASETTIPVAGYPGTPPTTDRYGNPAVETVTVEFSNSSTFTAADKQRYISEVVFPAEIGSTAQCNSPYISEIEASTPGGLWWDDVIAAANTWGARLWQYGLWMPPEDGANRWKIDGTAINVSIYWEKVCQGFAKHPSLSGGGSLQRYDIVTEPIGEGLTGLFNNNLFGSRTAFWGISRFKLFKFDLPSTRTYDSTSSAAWYVVQPSATSTDTPASLSFLSDKVRVAKTADGPVRVRLDLLAPTANMGFFGSLCSSVRLKWQTPLPSGVSLSAYWLSMDPAGESAKVGTAPRIAIDLSAGSDTVYSKPYAKHPRYMGSWGEDWGQDETTDLGTDSQSGGITAAAYDSLTNEAFQPFGTNRQYRQIEFVIEGLGIGDTFDIFYPTCSLAGGLKLFYERAARAFVIGNNIGPWRWGCFEYIHPVLGLLPWPISRATSYRPSILAALATIRNFAGVGVTSSWLQARATELYKWNVELAIPGHLETGPDDTLTNHSFLHYDDTDKLKAVLVNSYAETPPVPWFPAFERDQVTLAQKPAGGGEMRQYSWCQGARIFAEPIPNPDDSLRGEIWTPAPALLGGQANLTGPSGWRVWKATPTLLANGDDSVYSLRRKKKTADSSPTKWAEFRPWKGSIWTGYWWTLVRRWISGLSNYHLQSFTAFSDGDSLDVRRRQNPGLAASTVTPFSSTGLGPHSMATMGGMDEGILLVYETSAGVYSRTSYDDGETFIGETLVAAGAKYPAVVIDYHGDGAVFFVVDGLLKFKSRNPKGEFGAVTTCKDGDGADFTIADGTFSVVAINTGEEPWMLACVKDGEDEVSEWITTDCGKTFRRLS